MKDSEKVLLLTPGYDDRPADPLDNFLREKYHFKIPGSLYVGDMLKERVFGTASGDGVQGVHALVYEVFETKEEEAEVKVIDWNQGCKRYKA